MQEYGVGSEGQDAGLSGLEASSHFGECEVEVGHGGGVVQFEEGKHELLAVQFRALYGVEDGFCKVCLAPLGDGRRALRSIRICGLDGSASLLASFVACLRWLGDMSQF